MVLRGCSIRWMNCTRNSEVRWSLPHDDCMLGLSSPDFGDGRVHVADISMTKVQTANPEVQASFKPLIASIWQTLQWPSKSCEPRIRK